MEKIAVLPYLRSIVRGAEQARPLAGDVGSGVKRLGENLLGIGFGMKRDATGKFDPLAGVKMLGRAKVRNTSGPLAGMYQYDPRTGSHVFEEGRRPLEYLKQEFLGPKATRGDLAAQVFAGKKPMAKREYLAKMKAEGDRNSVAKFRGQDAQGRERILQQAAGKRNVGEYLAGATNAEKQQLSNINTMGAGEFIKNHPALAANWYGRKALHKGFLLGFPGLELYNTVAHNEGPDPEKGVAANVAGTAASTLGWASMTPLGWVGAPLAVDGITHLAKRMGHKLDQRLGNQPMTPKAAVPPQTSPVPQPMSQQTMSQAAPATVPPIGYPR